MTTHTANPHASPETTSPQSPHSLADLKLAWHIIWDAHAAHDRAVALLLIVVEHLHFGDHHEDWPRISPSHIGHVLRSGLDQLKAVQEHLEALESLTAAVGTTSRTPRPRPSEHRAWHELRHLWSTLEREDRAWVLRAARVLQQSGERKSELIDVLTRVATRPGSRASKGGRDA